MIFHLEIYIILGKGLRQGNLLSLYLFIIGTETLSRLLISVESNLDFHEIKITKNAPDISHFIVYI